MPNDEPQAGEFCPLGFLLKWKFKDGRNARVIMQGCRLEVTTQWQWVDKASSTLWRVGRSIVTFVCARARGTHQHQTDQ